MSENGSFGTGRAAVIGAGISGLLSARVLSDYFDEVIVVDRDTLPTRPADRSGVPQGRHLHSLATRGSELLEDLFPGLDAELAEAGAPRLDQARDAITVFPTGRLRRFESGITMRSVSRALLESRIRSRIADLPNVKFFQRTDATGLLPSSRERIAGLSYRDRSDPDTTGELRADLVLDASGNASRAPSWLSGIGLPAPLEEIVDAKLGYATRWYRVPEGFDDDWMSLAVIPDWPHNSTGGSLRRVENGLWTAVLLGIGEIQPPSGNGAEDAFLEYSRRLPSRIIFDALKEAEPVSKVYGYRRTANRRRRYEKMRLPENFLVTGDASCVLNPSYGQGVTLAALSSMALEHALTGGTHGLSLRFHRSQARALAPAWRTTTASDAQWSKSSVKELGVLGRYAHRVSDEVTRTATEDDGATRTLLEIKNLLKHPARIARPALILPAALKALFR